MGRFEFKGASMLWGLVVIGLSALPGGLARDPHFVADTIDCRIYYEVSNETWVQKKCGFGYKFDMNAGACVVGTCKQCDCWSQYPQECHIGDDGRWVVDPNDCHGYFMCAAGYKVKSYCDYRKVFDPESRTCIYGECGKCECTTTTEGETWTVDDYITEETDGASTEHPSTSATDTTWDTEKPASSTTDTTWETEEPSNSTTPSSSGTDTTWETEEPTSSTTDTTWETEEPLNSTTPSSHETGNTWGTHEPSNSTTPSSPELSTTTSSLGQNATVTPERTTVGTASTPVETGTTLPPFSPDAICRIKPDGSFFSDAYHCRQYWVCRNRTPVRLMCQRGTWFDDVHFVCNFPHLVDCPAMVD